MAKQNITTVEAFIAELENLVFTAARNWERRITIRQEDRDVIVSALRNGAALSTQETEEG